MGIIYYANNDTVIEVRGLMLGFFLQGNLSNNSWRRPPIPNFVEVCSIVSEKKEGDRHETSVCVLFMSFMQRTCNSNN
jgi:hypothetical protein